MGLLETMLGHKGQGAQSAETEARFAELKAKYRPVFAVMERLKVELQNLHVEDNKLLIRGTVPSDAAKNEIWEEIKRIDSSYRDLTADLKIVTQPESAAAPVETYTVKAGDTLSKIALHYYGDAKAYPRIFDANRDFLKDPDLIHPGQVLKIPGGAKHSAS